MIMIFLQPYISDISDIVDTIEYFTFLGIVVFTCKHKVYIFFGVTVYKMKITTKEVREVTSILNDIIQEYKEESVALV